MLGNRSNRNGDACFGRSTNMTLHRILPFHTPRRWIVANRFKRLPFYLRFLLAVTATMGVVIAQDMLA